MVLPERGVEPKEVGTLEPEPVAENIHVSAGALMGTGWESYGAVPPRLPVPASELIGRVFYVPPGQSFFWLESRRLCITRVRVDISLWYDGEWVWVEAEMLDNRGNPCGRAQALLPVSVFESAHPR